MKSGSVSPLNIKGLLTSIAFVDSDAPHGRRAFAPPLKSAGFRAERHNRPLQDFFAVAMAYNVKLLRAVPLNYFTYFLHWQTADGGIGTSRQFERPKTVPPAAY